MANLHKSFDPPNEAQALSLDSLDHASRWVDAALSGRLVKAGGEDEEAEALILGKQVSRRISDIYGHGKCHQLHFVCANNFTDYSIATTNWSA